MMEWKFKNKKHMSLAQTARELASSELQVSMRQNPRLHSDAGPQPASFQFGRSRRSQELAQSPGDAAVADTTGPGTTL